ncbi:hypothetical protein JCM10213_008257 [Rhodosporidiobolus nylandii]
MVNVATSPEGNLMTYLEDGTAVIYNGGDVAWVVTGTALVTMFVPGLALLYSGLLRRKNALSMLLLCFATYAVGQLLWMLFGYSFTYSETGGAFWGDFKYGGFAGVDIQPAPAPTIPAYLYAIFQAAFCAITMVVTCAGAAERCRILPFLVWVFCFGALVYCPTARWTWDAQGWLYNLGELDYAGGGPVHIASGFASFMLSVFLGPRRGYGTPSLDYRPQSTTLICLGTGFIWFGWLGFNGACMSALNLKSISCVVNTNIAASAGALGWLAMDWFFTRKFSAVGCCSGILAGLIGITPAVGYVGAPGAIAVGALTAVAANLATGIKRLLKVDDPIDAGALHGVGGTVGAILTGLFADSRVASFDGTVIPGGWINHHWIQLGYQLAGCVSIAAYTSVVSYLLLILINLIPGLKFRCSEDYEIVGIDEAEVGEFAHDYLHMDRDIPIRGRSPGLRPPAASATEKDQSSTGSKDEPMGEITAVVSRAGH